jgi:hypothetical protein
MSRFEALARMESQHQLLITYYEFKMPNAFPKEVALQIIPPAI